jgi:hypothetical protein
MRFRWQAHSRGEYYLREQWCNRFAAHLLISGQAISQVGLIDSPSKMLESVRTLSAHFRVSVQATARRLAELNPHVAVLRCEKTRKKSGEEVVRIGWSASMTDLPTLRQGRFLGREHCVSRAIMDGRLEGDICLSNGPAAIARFRGEQVVRSASRNAFLVAAYWAGGQLDHRHHCTACDSGNDKTPPNHRRYLE